VEKGATSRSVYLPQGTWFDFWTQAKQEGGREIPRDVDLATIPLYVRAGAVLPMDPIRQYTAEKVDGPMTLWIYPGADGKSTLYMDDGETFDYRKGKCTHVEIEWNDAQRRISLRLKEKSQMLPQAKRHIQARVVGEKGQKDFTFEGRPVSFRLS
jgi:alpha-glucosidase/alpha-D-xyloside xylohydrolase